MKNFFVLLKRVISIGVNESLRRIERAEKEARIESERIEKLEREARTDILTGLLNRRGLEDRLDLEKERSNRYGHPFLVVYIDMDNLKEINDSQGHEAGDAALISLAENIERSCRTIDFAARFGGDEFIIVFPETSENDAEIILERIREIQNISVGYCQYSPDVALNEVVNKAEKQMYEEKKKKKGAD